LEKAVNDVNQEAAGGRQSPTETIETKLANPATSSELDRHNALNDASHRGMAKERGLMSRGGR
jgi:hypothetical protein